MSTPSTFKVTKEVEQAIGGWGRKGPKTTKLFVNGTLVATEHVGTDLYCRVKNGERSRLREVSKKCVRVSWEYSALRALLPQGAKFNFDIQYPDLTWGFTGEGLSAAGLKERIAQAVASVTPVEA